MFKKLGFVALALVLLTISAVLILPFITAANDPGVTGEHALAAIGKDVVPRAYDNEKGTVYFSTVPADYEDQVNDDGEDFRVASLITKKLAWEMRFPNKRIVAMTTVTGERQALEGLLVHYEYVTVEPTR